MGYVIALFSTLTRLFHPTRGAHTSPSGTLRELAFEARRIRSGRVRRYAETLPAADNRTSPAPRCPANDLPRTLVPVPRDYVPVVNPHEIEAPADIVRGYYRAHEARTERLRADRTRLGVAVLHAIATANRAKVSA